MMTHYCLIACYSVSEKGIAQQFNFAGRPTKTAYRGVWLPQRREKLLCTVHEGKSGGNIRDLLGET